MVSNSLKLTIRGLVKFKFYSLSTVIGFGTSLVIAAIAAAFYVYEVSTDNFIDNNVNRILMTDPVTNKLDVLTYHELVSALKDNYKEVEDVTHVIYPGYKTIIVEQKGEPSKFVEKGVLICDGNFLDIFNFKLRSGNAKTCLQHSNSVLLTDSYALKYFGSLDALGRTVLIDSASFEVTGVIEETRDNSHLKVGLVLSYEMLSLASGSLDQGGFTYFRLAETASKADFETQLNIDRHALLSYRSKQWPADPFKVEDIKQAYFHRDYEPYLLEIFKSRERSILFTYALVAIVIFIVALVNFIIYFFSKTLANAKQLVVKKIFGVDNGSVFLGFFTESFIILCLGYMVGILGSIVLIPHFNVWSGSSIPVFYVFNVRVVLIIFCCIVLASLILALLFFLIFFKLPTSLLFSGEVRKMFSKNRVLKGLMFLQLSSSLTLIMSFIMIKDQIRMISSYSLGYNHANLIEIDLSSFQREFNPQVIKSEYLAQSNIESASLCFGGPLTGRWSRNVNYKDTDSDFGFYQVDADFVQTLDLTILEGSNFKGVSRNDSSYLLINETGLKFFEIDNIDSIRNDLPMYGKIVGVVKDFHYSSLKDKIAPAFLEFKSYEKIGRYGAHLILRLKTVDRASIELLKSTWRKFSPDQPLEYKVVSEGYRSFYQDKINESKLLSISVFGIILVTCFGIIGFTAFLAQRRLKEMAIRKVLGASVSSLFSLWGSMLGMGLFVSTCIALPISLYVIDKWSMEYVYKQPTSYLAIPISLAIIFTAIVVASFHNIWQVSIRNSADVLRHD